MSVHEKRSELFSKFSELSAKFTELFMNYTVYKKWLEQKGKANVRRGRIIRKKTVELANIMRGIRKEMLELEEEIKNG